MNKTLPPTKVWWDFRLWNVVQIYQKNKHEMFLTLERVDTESSHDDGSLVREMVTIDVHNDEFYPDTQRVRILLKRLENVSSSVKKLENELGDIYLQTVLPE